MPGGGYGLGSGGGGLSRGGVRLDGRTIGRTFVRLDGRSEILPFCSLGHHPLRVSGPGKERGGRKGKGEGERGKGKGMSE